MLSVDRCVLTRRHFQQLSVAALALAAAPSPVTHAQGTPASTVVSGNTAFALALYNQLRQGTDGNLLVSPYSISLALAMAAAGAAGETAAQLAATLGLELATDNGFASLSDDLATRGTAEEDPDTGRAARGLVIANTLWGEQTFPFSNDYLAQLKDGYGAALNLVDFIGNPADARDEINDWVADKTNDRIKDIVPQSAITRLTRLVLANAIWFAGPWQSTFNPELTEDGEFALLDGSTAIVPLMNRDISVPYASGNGYQALELPFDGSGFAFTIILPDEGAFESVEASAFDPAMLEHIVGDLKDTAVRLAMPRFSFEFAATLADTLRALGIVDAFDPDRADFSGMVDDIPADPLVISDVLHKAFIAVDENGTEAAAVTVVLMGATSAQEPEKRIEVRIDRPFVFAIRDTETGTLLFLGRLLDPR